MGGQPETPTRTASQLAESFGGEKAIARPSRDSTLGFTFPVEISEILVKGGHAVKKGDVLIRGDDSEFKLQYEQQKAVAESDLDIRRAQASVDQVQVEFDVHKRMREDPTTQGGSQIEYERARTLLALRKVEHEIAGFQSEQARIQLRFREAQLDRFVIRAPFDGRIDQIVGDLGEVKKDAEPVIRVVDTRVLWIDVATPTAQTLTLALKPGDSAWVLIDLPGEPRVYPGKVIELAADADPASQTRRVRVELVNSKDWPGGLTCWVRFTAPQGDWAPRVVAGVAAAPPGRPGAVP
jgi:RND family efflux transporter MFP subunit